MNKFDRDRDSRAVQYLRMSTERQDYSIDSQKEFIGIYAADHHLNVIRTYEDAGISGLTLVKRSGLTELLAEVISGRADFSTILVYDVSRWGRFQNLDQAAHYEFICNEAGVKVIYCAEVFQNDGTPTSALLKHLKRAMAAEYSLELSRKVSRAQRSLLADGFWIGGRAPIGLRRDFVLRDGQSIESVNDKFVRKQQGVRTKLVLGPEHEVRLVKRIFRNYLRPGATCTTVATSLANDPKADHGSRAWSRKRVRDILKCEAYCGTLTGGRYIRRVGDKTTHPLPRDQWIDRKQCCTFNRKQVSI